MLTSTKGKRKMKMLISDVYFKNKYGRGEYVLLPWAEKMLEDLKGGGHRHYYVGGGRSAAVTTQTILVTLAATVGIAKDVKVLILSQNPDKVFGSLCVAASALLDGGAEKGGIAKDAALCKVDLRKRELEYGDNVTVVVRRGRVATVRHTKMKVGRKPKRLVVMFDGVHEFSMQYLAEIRDLIERNYAATFLFTYNVPSCAVGKVIHEMAERDGAFVTEGHTSDEVPRHWIGGASPRP